MLARRSLFRLALSLFTLVLLVSFTAPVAEARNHPWDVETVAEVAEAVN